MKPAYVDFWGRIAGNYDAGVDYILGNNLRRIILEKLGKEQKLGRTVEFGCGTGYFTPQLAQLADSVVATDISDVMLDRVQERTRKLERVTIRREDCEKTSFAEGYFDTAFLGLTFQVVDGPSTIAEMQRILRPGGQLILAIPTMEGMGIADKVRCMVRCYQTYKAIRPPGTHLYTVQSLTPVITGGGFRLREIDRLSDPAHPEGFSGIYLRAVRP
jgi:ubiquinone/menaquinone biosynthesis C-methylase UbiE